MNEKTEIPKKLELKHNIWKTLISKPSMNPEKFIALLKRGTIEEALEYGHKHAWEVDDKENE